MDDVHPLRDGLRADLVHLIQASSFRGGQAQVLGPFGVTHYDVLSLMSHELGHSMGLQHDRYNDASNHPFPYSHGYVNQAAFAPGAPHASRFATNMAYNNQCGDAGFFCPWTNTFSNPDMTYNGYPMGVRGDAPSSAVDGPADARRSLNELRTTVANFRVRSPGPDLVAQSTVVTDSTLSPNQAFRLSASVRNIGDRASAGTTVAYYRSSDSTISSADTLVRTGVLAGLGRGEARLASIEVTAPAQPRDLLLRRLRAGSQWRNCVGQQLFLGRVGSRRVGDGYGMPQPHGGTAGSRQHAAYRVLERPLRRCHLLSVHARPHRDSHDRLDVLVGKHVSSPTKQRPRRKGRRKNNFLEVPVVSL